MITIHCVHLLFDSNYQPTQLDPRLCKSHNLGSLEIPLSSIDVYICVQQNTPVAFVYFLGG